MKKKYGKKAFTKKGTLKTTYVDKVIHSPTATKHRKKQAQFAKNTKKFKH